MKHDLNQRNWIMRNWPCYSSLAPLQVETRKMTLFDLQLHSVLFVCLRKKYCNLDASITHEVALSGQSSILYNYYNTSCKKSSIFSFNKGIKFNIFKSAQVSFNLESLLYWRWEDISISGSIKIDKTQNKVKVPQSVSHQELVSHHYQQLLGLAWISVPWPMDATPNNYDKLIQEGELKVALKFIKEPKLLDKR